MLLPWVKKVQFQFIDYVHPGQSLVNGRDRREYHAFDKENLELDGYDRLPRQKADHVDGENQKKPLKIYELHLQKNK